MCLSEDNHVKILYLRFEMPLRGLANIENR